MGTWEEQQQQGRTQTPPSCAPIVNEETRGVFKGLLENIIRDSVTYTEHARVVSGMRREFHYTAFHNSAEDGPPLSVSMTNLSFY